MIYLDLVKQLAIEVNYNIEIKKVNLKFLAILT